MKNSSKGLVVPLLVSVIVVLVTVSGIYVYENKKAEVSAVPLGSVLTYARVTNNNYVTTSGNIVSINRSQNSIILTDNQASYILVTIAQVFVTNYSSVFSQLHVGEKITVRGIASETTDIPLSRLDNGTIGVVNLVSDNDIQVSM